MLDKIPEVGEYIYWPGWDIHKKEIHIGRVISRGPLADDHEYIEIQWCSPDHLVPIHNTKYDTAILSKEYCTLLPNGEIDIAMAMLAL